MCSPGGGTKGQAPERSDNFIYETAHFNADCVNVFKKKNKESHWLLVSATKLPGD